MTMKMAMTGHISRWLLLCVLLVMLPHVLVSAVQFDVRANAEKCLSDDIASGSLVVLSYSVEDASITGKTGVSLRVEDPERRIVQQDANIDMGEDQDTRKRSFRADEGGSYGVCFTNSNRADIRVRLVWKHGVEAQDYSEVARREHLLPVEQELRRMEDAVDELYHEMVAMREREAAMRATNDATNVRVLWFSCFSIAMLVGVGAWQVLYLKNFFQSKKLI